LVILYDHNKPVKVDATLKLFVHDRLASGVKASTVNRSLEVVRTTLHRAARSYRDGEGRPWLDAVLPLITRLPESPRPPYPITWDVEPRIVKRCSATPSTVWPGTMRAPNVGRLLKLANLVLKREGTCTVLRVANTSRSDLCIKGPATVRQASKRPHLQLVISLNIGAPGRT
jgi:type II secretory pathway pseudopilin PulG